MRIEATTAAPALPELALRMPSRRAPRTFTLTWRTLLCMVVAGLPIMLLGSQPYWLNILTFTYLMAGLATAWNLIGGFGGQFSLCHAVFFGIGAYVTTLLYMNAGVSPWIGVVLSIPVAILTALLIAWPAFRLRGPFFAIATMALNQVALALANYATAVTGGAQGVMIPFRAGFLNMIFRERWKSALLMFAFMVVAIAIAVALRYSRLGYRLVALREDEDVARASGVNVLATKLIAMAISAGLTTVGGGLFAFYIRFIDPPSAFALTDIGMQVALLSLIGGLGTLSGPVIGAGIIVPLQNILQVAVGGLWPGAPYVVLAAIMILAARFFGGGLVGSATMAWASLSARRRAGR